MYQLKMHNHYANEPIAPKDNNHPPVVRCHYCEKLIKTEDIENNSNNLHLFL